MNAFLETLQNLKQEQIIPIISVIGGFTGASLGQVVGHYFTQNRDTAKDKKEKYQNFFSPLAFKIILYIKCEEAYYTMKTTPSCMKLGYPHPRKVFQDILDTLKTNIKYATPEIMSSYEELNRISVFSMPASELEGVNKVHYEILERESFLITQSDEWEKFSTHRFEFCKLFLSEYLTISTDLESIPSSIEKEVSDTLFTCKVNQLCENIYAPNVKTLFLTNASQRSIPLKTIVKLNAEIDQAEHKIENLITKNRKKNTKMQFPCFFHRKKNTKMQFSCFLPGFKCLENIIKEGGNNEYIRSELTNHLDSDKEYSKSHIRSMNSDRTFG
ncbi:hypothetical protein CN394_14285 [Bacillus anthracis]|nr:hypothetical protein CN394_14285 [Bacillus anthracis]